MKIGLIRGKYLNEFEMQSYEFLGREFELVGFASKRPIGNKFYFKVNKLFSPMDIPDFPMKMPFINRLFIDGHLLFGLEKKLLGFDIAHCAETYTGMTWQCLKAKRKNYVRKVVLTVWENIPFANEKIWGRKSIKKRALREVDLFIACSKRAKYGLILEGVNLKKIRVIYPGINLSLFKPVDKKEGKINFLFVGRLEDCKGVFEILYAIKILLDDKEIEGKKLFFHFVGQGKEKEKIINESKKMGLDKKIKINSVTEYRKMPKVYQQASVFWAPSKRTSVWQEQFSMALLEAQACGLPIITTRCGSIDENVGENALYVGEGDFWGIYKAAKKLILNSELRRKMGYRARERVEIFDAKKVSLQIANVYKELFNKKNG